MALLDILPAVRPARPARSARLAPPRQAGVTVPGTLWAMAGAAGVVLLVSLAAGAVDPRLLDGAPVWAKPAKFALSLMVHFATLALVLGLASPARRERADIRLVAGAMAAAFAFEMGYIALQAARGLRSHWNADAPIYEVLYGLMGLGALVLTLGAGHLGWTAARDRAARMGPGLRAGALWGFPLGAALTVLVAGWMSFGDGRFVGTPAPGAATIPLMG